MNAHIPCSRADADYMARALRLAERGLYTTDPNPRVGCVLVKAGRIVGEGWHRKAGGPHAEIEAVAVAGTEARGATAYVSLEPCCHHGRTPPCTEALIAAGVTRVVAALEDPNPKVAGAGMARLAAAGIDTHCGLLAGDALNLNRGFCQRMATGRPWLRSKLAMSLDGRTAMASGESRWITGADARRDVHRLRARSSAIVTGIGTALADDPELTARLGEDAGAIVQPIRIVLDSRLRLPSTARLADGRVRTVVLTTAAGRAARQDIPATLEMAVLPTDAEDRIDLTAVVEWLGRAGCNEVLVESGPTLNGALLRAGLVDEWIVYLAPVVLGDQARGLFHLPGLSRMADRHELRLADTRQVGQDIRLTFLKA
ncbi:bifunctional diaminohydroxyphosphoribosylaminopyrimidine deaminase/5-amino-6-(5-phosphoribosylamino)uracil reductase RibD [Methylomagnum ishizawai]|uniref:bifunctional diaminohydroxyphosphoribosylaminopyrimidine deaminase/5-amino-6-(5-phosphoribosylamino)uracil reductase RibD n=1 Tax=Methylomagnum ishizawai TaxID=1760988 RepID=UPI001C342835|nr:bifunctional diaminohydroxyphosphoribosylaminopyrimidine deaminase/5-amino-6-(5-phosphoribosylamino)uracil reductase RibD [Methylomagnum ishizawai]BBL74039.1 riboflavin biosynthesis protein RibD [Methylomagnum ishizawai]